MNLRPNTKSVAQVAASALEAFTQMKKSLVATVSTASRSPKDSTTTPKSGYRKSTSPSGLPLSKILTNAFPLPLSESFQHYKRRKQLDQIQDDILSLASFYPTPTATHEAKVIKTVINDETGDYINEFQISPVSPTPNAKHLVVIHGYGAGLGFFIKNLEKLATLKPDWHIHAIDLLGYGCSSRPDFPHHIPYENYSQIESFFIESIKKWFDLKNLNSHNPNGDPLVVAHSMGAYLSAVTDFKYPGLFKKIIMVSPAGVYSSHKPTIPTWFEKLWNLNVSPFILVRNTGPLGSYFTSGWTSRRFSKSTSVLNEKEQELMHMYTYAIFNGKGSGEYMLNYLLAPGAVPRNPLLYRINNMNCDSSWYYGDHDWMDVEGGVRACRRLNQGDASEGHGDRKADLKVVSGSGHHIYLDNFDGFNELIVNEMNQFEKR